MCLEYDYPIFMKCYFSMCLDIRWLLLVAVINGVVNWYRFELWLEILTFVCVLVCNADVNECATSPCDANAACANTAGSYTCTCNSGYTGNGTSCTGKMCYCLIIW